MNRRFFPALVWREHVLLSVVLGSLFLAAALYAQSGDKKKRIVFNPGESQPDVKASVLSEDKNTPAEQVKNFFHLLREGKLAAAYEGITKDTIISENKADVEALEQQTEKAIAAYGGIAGFEFVSSQAAGKHLFRMTCLSLNTDLPLRWRFYFYASGGQWRLIDIRIDDGLMELFGDGDLKPRPKVK
ncbi:MAG: hypothetical protein ACK5LK_08775 [Chthoniobacterales bacterium]